MRRPTLLGRRVPGHVRRVAVVAGAVALAATGFVATAGAASSTISAVGSLANKNGAGTSTLSVSPQHVGDLVTLAVKIASATVTASGVSGGGVATWSRAEGPYAGYSGYDLELWSGTVTATGSSTVTVSFSGSVSAVNVGLAAQEFTSSSGSSTTWAVDTGGAIDNASSTTATFPKLTPSGTGEVYFGYDAIAQTGSAGSTSGFTYATTADADVVTYDTDVTGAVQPTATQSPAGVSGGVAVLVTASGVAPAPTVTALGTTSGPATGGTSVVITGTGFTGATAVSFGGTTTTSFTVNTPTAITVTSPAFAVTGAVITTTVDVTVAVKALTSATSAADKYTYTYSSTGGATCTGTCSVTLTANAAPAPTGVTAPTGTSGTSVVSLVATASQDVSGLADGLSIVDVSTSPPTVVAHAATGTSLTAGVSDASAATVRYVGEIDDCPSGGPYNPTTCPLATIFATSAPAFVTWTPTPAVTAIAPSSGPATGGTSVSITGTGFAGATGVDFGTSAATSFTVNSPTSITATSPAGSSTVDVMVVGPGGTSTAVTADHFTYSSASIPVSAVGTLANKSGTGTTTLSVSPQRPGDLVILAVKVASSSISVLSVSGGGASPWGRAEGPYTGYNGYDLELWTGTVTAAGPSTITVSFTGSVSALNVGLAAQEFSATTWAIDTGGGISNTSSTTATFPKLTPAVSNELYFGYDAIAETGSAGSTSGFTYATTTDADVAAYDPDVTGAVQPTAVQSPAGTSGGVAVLIASSASSTASGVTVTSGSPSSGKDTGGTAVTITGTGFSGVTAVNFGTVKTTSFVVNSPTQIVVTAPAGPDGTVDVTMTTSAGASATSTADQFTNVTTKAGLIPIGVYPPAGGSDPAGVAAWGQTTGTDPTHALDFLDKADGWSGLDSATGMSAWTGSGYQLVLAVPMIPTDSSGTAQGTLAQGATGAYDQYFTTLAQNLVADGEGNAILRLGWEFNGNWYAWSVASATDATNYVAYWQKIVTTMRAVPGAAFKFFWNPNGPSPTSYTPDQAYPGDAYVDYVGTDVYDNFWGTPFTTQASWVNQLGQQWGLDWLASFAAEHAKPIAIAEWSDEYRDDGHGFGDDPSFVDNMANWFVANNVAFTDVFSYDSSATYRNNLLDGTFPNSLAEFEKVFG